MRTNMKKLIIMAILGLFGTAAAAQTSQGTVVLSGSVGYSKTTDNEGDEFEQYQSTFNISPSIGYFISDGLEVGASIGYQKAKNNMFYPTGWDMIEIEQETSLFAFAPYLTKYFMVSDRVALTGTGSVGFSKGTSTFSFDSDKAESDLSGFQLAVVPGITFFPTEKIGINASFGSLGYASLTSEPKEGEGKTKSSNLGLNLNASTLNVGFSYHF